MPHRRNAGSKQDLVGGTVNVLLVVERIGALEKQPFRFCSLQHDIPVLGTKVFLFPRRACNVLHGAREPALGDLLHVLRHQAL
ncbi:hypothetical protein ASG40_19915 [Methylobacterium sp. Leaf399]|nr:hypothetical protein ASG40_19915 [Methylobacterium sp. Leaf399]